MAERFVSVKNISGDDFPFPPPIGWLGDGIAGQVAASVLLGYRDAQRTLAKNIDDGDAEITYDGGMPLTKAEMESFADVVASRALAGTPLLLNAVDGAVAAAGGDAKVLGSGLLQGQGFDSITIGSGADQVYFELLTPGDSEQTLELVDTGSISVAFDGTKWTIGFDAGVSTPDAIANFVNSNATAKGKIRCVSGGAGTATPATVETALIGGTGDFAGNLLTVGGLAALPKSESGTAPNATWTNDSIEMTHGALTGLAASDMARIRVKANSLADAIDAVLS